MSKNYELITAAKQMVEEYLENSYYPYDTVIDIANAHDIWRRDIPIAKRAAVATVLSCGTLYQGTQWMTPPTKLCLLIFPFVKKQISKGRKVEVEVLWNEPDHYDEDGNEIYREVIEKIRL